MGADLRKGMDGLYGSLHLGLGNIASVINQTSVNGGLFAAMNVASLKPSDSTADLSGAVHLRDIAVQSGTRRVRDWWADLALDHAHLDASENLNLTSDVRARFRDELPVLNVLASQRRIPGWIPRVFPIRGATLDMQVDH